MIGLLLTLALAQEIHVTVTPQSQKTTRALYGNVSEMSTWEARVCLNVPGVAVIPIERVLMAFPKARFMSPSAGMDLLKVKRSERPEWRGAKVLEFLAGAGAIVATRGGASLDWAHGFAIATPMLGGWADGLRQRALIFDPSRLLPEKVFLEGFGCASGALFSNDPRPKVGTLEADIVVPRVQ